LSFRRAVPRSTRGASPPARRRLQEIRPVTFDSLRAVGGVRSGCLCWGRSRRAVALPLEERESPQVQSVPSGARASRSGEEIPASARVVRSAAPAAHRTRGAVALGPCGLWPPAGSPRGGFWQTAWGLPLELACPRKGVLSSQLALRACRLSRCVVLCDVGWSVGREREREKLPCLALVWAGELEFCGDRPPESVSVWV